MPLTFRPFEGRDVATFRDRFSPEGRAPWIHLPAPYTLEDVLAQPPGLDMYVAEQTGLPVVGLVALDRGPGRGNTAMLVGPLVADEQLADLTGRALLNYGLERARAAGVATVRVGLDLQEDRGLTFFLAHGFELLETRRYVMVAKKGKRPDIIVPDGLKVAHCPELLSSEYLAMVKDLGNRSGPDRAEWSRPQVFEHLQQSWVQVLAARTGETFLGLVELNSREDTGVDMVVWGVLPEYQALGVGGALLDAAIGHAFEVMGGDRLYLEVTLDDPTRGVNAFQRRGFRPDRAVVYLEKSLAAVSSPSRA